MRKPQGHFFVTNNENGENEVHDTFTCGHCQYVTIVKPMMDPADLGGLCKQCMSLICRACVALGRCDPWDKMFERAEARDRFRRQCGLG